MKPHHLSIFLLLCLCGCGTASQNFPVLLAETDRSIVYSASGVTDAGANRKSDMEKYPQQLVSDYCRKGGRIKNLVQGRFENVAGQKEWHAIIECSK